MVMETQLVFLSFVSCKKELNKQLKGIPKMHSFVSLSLWCGPLLKLYYSYRRYSYPWCERAFSVAAAYNTHKEVKALLHAQI